MIKIEQISIEKALENRETIPIIDVRTPAEFELGHIKGAVNLPLFTNEERATVGTIYKQKSKEQAILKGLEIVGPRMRELTVEAKKISKHKKAIIHCWRGGMRSYSIAWMLKLYGLDVQTISGGYKAYRQYLKTRIAEKANIIILGGMTGSGKTELLELLKNNNQQIIDLEKEANHKGSVFGHIGEQKQLPNEQFENNLCETFIKLNLSEPIWIEDEGRSIGRNFVPDELFKQMRAAKVIKIEVPKPYRTKRLVDDYTNFGKEVLIESINKIAKRLGGKNTKEAIEAIEQNNLEKAAEISLIYYDKAYQHGLSQRNPDTIFSLKLTEKKHDNNIIKLIEFHKVLTNGTNKTN